MIAVLLKSTVALLLALTFVVAARRSRASVRHLILAASFIFLLLLPLVQRFAPAVEIPVAQNALVAATGPAPAVVAITAAHAEIARNTPINFLAIASNLYFAVAALLLVHLVIGIARLRILAARAEVWLDGTARTNEIAHAANIRRATLVVLSDLVAVPLTFGFIRSTIVLPEAARNWSADELTRALRHELEHVRREDWLLQLAARAACALYWPQPLVWIAWRRFCLEAERACDDAVLGTSEPAVYAGQLVALARKVNRINSVPALGMASRSKLATRVDAILDATQRRGPHSRSAAAAVAIALLGLLVSIAPARLTAQIAAHSASPQIADTLVKAAQAGDFRTVQRLLDDGVPIDTVAPGDGTALIGAARGGQLAIVELLLSRGADPNLQSRGDGSPLTAAAAHGHLAIVERLLDSGARIDDIVRGNENALIQASMNNRVDLVKYLIRRGADVNARAIEGSRVRTPLSVASRHDTEVARLLFAAGATE